VSRQQGIRLLLLLSPLISVPAESTGGRAPIHQPGAQHQQLPRPFVKVVLDNDLYYYSSGFFYRHINNRYVVVEAPLGARVNSLPSGFAQVAVDGAKFSFFEGTWFVWRPELQAYEVVANPAHQPIQQQAPASPDKISLPTSWLERLPDGATAIRIDGVQYFEHAGIYYQPTVVKGTVGYRKVIP